MPRADRYIPGQETGYPFYRRLGGLQSRSGWVQKIWLPPGLDSRTVHLVASCIPNELSRSIPYGLYLGALPHDDSWVSKHV